MLWSWHLPMTLLKWPKKVDFCIEHWQSNFIVESDMTLPFSEARLKEVQLPWLEGVRLPCRCYKKWQVGLHAHFNGLYASRSFFCGVCTPSVLRVQLQNSLFWERLLCSTHGVMASTFAPNMHNGLQLPFCNNGGKLECLVARGWMLDSVKLRGNVDFFWPLH